MGFLKKIHYYKIWQFIVAGIILFLIAPRLATLLEEWVNTSSLRISLHQSAYVRIVRIGLLVIWVYIFYSYEQSLIYKEKTGGRNYQKDFSHYKRSFNEMAEYLGESKKYQMPVDSFPKIDWRQAEGVILGHVGKHLIARESSAKGNLALFALPGGGKTTSQMIPTALRFSGSVLAIDIKGDILAVTKHFRNIKVFSPDCATGSCHFNLLYGIAEMQVKDRKIALELMAMIIVPAEKEAYFSDGGRDFYCGIALFMIAENPKLTFPQLVHTILQGNGIDWVMRIREGTCEEAKEYTNGFYGTNERNVAGAYQNLVKKIRPFSNGDLDVLLGGDGDCITPETLEEGFDIYLEIPQEKISTYAPLTTLIVQIFMRAFLSRPDMSTGKDLRPLLFLLDEFDQLGFEYDTLLSALATLRSRKVSVYMAQQSISMMKKRYGDEGFRSIIDTCGYVCLMSAQDPDNRAYFQELVGKHKVYRSSVSENNKTTVRSSQEAEEFIFESQDFNNMGDKVLIYSEGKYILADKCNINNQEALALIEEKQKK